MFYKEIKLCHEMKNVSIIIFLVVFFISCTDIKDSTEYKIRGNNYKYWLLIKEYPDSELDKEEILVYYFDESYFYRHFKYNLFAPLIKDEYPYMDMDIDNSWGLINDSTLAFNGINFVGYIIKYLTDDTMILFNEVSNQYMFFISVTDDQMRLMNSNFWHARSP